MSSTAPRTSQLLAFARELQRATSIEELVALAHAEVRQSVGYEHTWMFLWEEEPPQRGRLVDFAGLKRGVVWATAPTLRLDGDPLLREIAQADAPVVVDDARTDPRTNKELITRLGNRTIVNVPLRLLADPLGALGTGTFDDEGPRPPSPAQLDYLVAMASQLSVAAGRIRLEESRRVLIRELEESQGRLREAVRARDEFLSVASHELKTPLMSLGLLVESAQRMLAESDTPPKDKLQTKLASASRQIGRLGALVNQLLDVTRITAGQLRMTKERLDLAAVVRATIAEQEDAARRAGSAITLTAEDGVVGEWDRVGVESVVRNIVVNAIKYGAGKSIEIEVDRLENQARLVVTDHGIGIAPAAQERIFHRFERAVLQEHPGGLGLGLWIARQTLEAHGGSIAVASRPGAGSIFTILLPLAAGPHDG